MQVINKIRSGLRFTAAFVLGSLIALYGTAEAATNDNSVDKIKHEITLGNKDSTVDVYIFTDWLCPSCRKLEPIITDMFPEISKDAKITFIDYPIHEETLNFVPYNLSFMINNKNDYLKLRHMLTDVSTETSTPTDELIEKEVKKLNLSYKQLTFIDVEKGNQYFKELAHKYEVHKTPSIVIVNQDTEVEKKLTGSNDITKANVINAIKALKNK